MTNAEEMMPTYPDPHRDKRAERLRAQLEEWNAELIEIEEKIAEVEHLEAIGNGLEASQRVLESIAGSEDVREKAGATLESLQLLIATRDKESLFSRRRELKQLVQQAAIDETNRPESEQA